MKVLAALLTFALLLAVHAVPASAHTKRFDISAEMGYDPGDGGIVYADVSSSKAQCVPDRKVKVREDPSGDLAASGLTDAVGSWSTPSSDVGSGDYTIQVTKLFLRRDSAHKHICLGTPRLSFSVP